MNDEMLKHKNQLCFPLYAVSRFLAKVRVNHHLLKEGDGGCALWHNRAWLQEIL